MTPTPRSLAALAAGALIATLGATPLSAQPEATQTFVLQPGWNAIYLEVRPEPNDTDTVFGGLPLASAWTWNPAFPKPDFIENPSEELIDSPAWQGYFPRPRPESVLTNLFAVQSNRAYLLKIDGEAPVIWTVRGRPEIRNPKWAPDSFNLVGFPVDPAIPPTFATFLAPSPAHAGQAIFRLVGGSWQQVNPAATSIRPGEAYWVYCKGPSDYSGPIDISLNTGTELAYGGALGQAQLRIRNMATAPASIRLTQIPGAAPLPLQIYRFDPDTGQIAWPMLPAQHVESIPERGELLIDLAPKRAAFTSDTADLILEVSNGFGFKRSIAVSAKTAFAPPAFALRRAAEGRALDRALATGSVNPFAGLWVGTARVTKVSEAQDGSLEPTPVKDAFGFRVLIHVDASGTVRLLKEVIQLWVEGTRVPDPENPGAFMVDEPGHYVLVTDESLISSFEGATLRDGEPVGLRVSTIAYDFPQEFQVMTGSFAPGGTVAATLVVDSQTPTNPFLHRFHPDHDNLDSRFAVFREEAYPVGRSMSFELTPVDPQGVSRPGYGDDQISGIYRETLSGLHRNDIAVEGFVNLRRASGRPFLNQ
jgi:hypothetical protein